jgi:CheY-like chemotaxis protein
MESFVMYKFLIVDDQEDLLVLLQERLLKAFKSTVTSARSGRDAINLLEMGFKFDLIVCDFQMSDGDGEKVFEYVQRCMDPIPFILYTSSVNPPQFQGNNFLGIVSKEKINRLTELIDSRLSL